MSEAIEQCRSNDVAVAILQEQQRHISTELSDVSALIKQHVEGCARVQKYVLGVLLFIAGWTVAHSPETVKLLSSILRSMP